MGCVFLFCFIKKGVCMLQKLFDDKHNSQEIDKKSKSKPVRMKFSFTSVVQLRLFLLLFLNYFDTSWLFV